MTGYANDLLFDGCWALCMRHTESSPILDLIFILWCICLVIFDVFVFVLCFFFVLCPCVSGGGSAQPVVGWSSFLDMFVGLIYR